MTALHAAMHAEVGCCSHAGLTCLPAGLFHYRRIVHHGEAFLLDEVEILHSDLEI